MANAGRAELDIVAVGKDQVSAMLRQIDGQLKTTKTQMDNVAAATTRVGVQTASMAERMDKGIGPLDKLRGLAEKVTSNFGFLVGALGGVAVGVAAFVSDMLAAERQLSSTAQAFFETSKNTTALSRELVKVQSEALKASRSMRQFESDLASVGAQAARVRGDAALAETFERQARAAQTRGTIEAAELRLNDADTQANLAEKRYQQLQKQRRDLELDISSLKLQVSRTEAASGLENTRAREELAAASVALVNTKLAADLAGTAYKTAATNAAMLSRELVALDELELAQEAEPTKGKGSGGAPARGAGRVPVLSIGRAAESPAVRTLDQIRTLAPSATEALDALLYKTAEVGAFRFMADDVTQLADAIDRMVSGLEKAADAALPGFGASLTELQGISAGYAEQVAALNEQVVAGTLDVAVAEEKAAQARTQGLIAGTTAVAAGLAKMLGGLRAEYVVRSAGEFAAGVATSFTNPAEAATHFLASGLYAAAAAQAGGGGGGGRSASGGGGSNPRTARVAESSGPTTIVNNFSSLLVDRQQVSRALSEVDARGQRSGYQRRRGA